MRYHQWRPSRLLNLNKSPRANKDITARNLAKSKLLALPPELKERIYALVLGGETIHMFPYDRNSMRLRLCQLPDDVLIEARRRSRAIDDDDPLAHKVQNGVYHRHCEQSHNNVKTRISIALLATCRTIYHEAVMMPFTHNIFDFQLSGCLGESTLHMAGKNWLQHLLVPAQLQAITHACFTDLHETRDLAFMRHRVKGVRLLDITYVPQFASSVSRHGSYGTRRSAVVDLSEYLRGVDKLTVRLCVAHGATLPYETERVVREQVMRMKESLEQAGITFILC